MRPENGVSRIDLVVGESQDFLSGQGLWPICAENHIAHYFESALADDADLPVDTLNAFIDIVDNLFPKLQFNAETRSIIGEKFMNLPAMPSKLIPHLGQCLVSDPCQTITYLTTPMVGLPQPRLFDQELILGVEYLESIIIVDAHWQELVGNLSIVP